MTARTSRTGTTAASPAARPVAKPRPAGEDVSRVKEYVAALPPVARRQLRRLRTVVRAAVPEAVDGFGYGMPAFRLHGKGLVWYAAWKAHVSLYPISAATERALARDLPARATSGKGTARFRLDRPLPTALVRRLVLARAEELVRQIEGVA